jgi:hypothetical protein
MSRRVFAAASLALATAASPSLLPALFPAQQGELDRGSFTLFLNDVRIGEERFLIRQERGGGDGQLYRSAAEQDLKIDGRTMRVSMALEATGARARPRRYEAEVNGGAATSIVATVVSERLRLEIRSPQGQEVREFLVRGRAAILDRHVAHHYFFAAVMLAGDAAVETCVISPRDQTQEAYRIESRGPDEISVAGRDVVATHLVLTSDSGSTRHVWLDGMKVLRVEIPDAGFIAVRSDGVDAPTNSARGTS